MPCIFKRFLSTYIKTAGSKDFEHKNSLNTSRFSLPCYTYFQNYFTPFPKIVKFNFVPTIKVNDEQMGIF